MRKIAALLFQISRAIISSNLKNIRYGLSLFFLLFLLMPSIAQEKEKEDERTIIRVLSFNILHGATTTGEQDLDLIARIINTVNPDLVALQEVDFRTDRAEKRDLATYLALHTNKVPFFTKAMDYDNGEYGQAILSNYSFASARKISLPGQPTHEPRIAAEAILVLPTGDSIRFAGTHLDHLNDSPDRIAQVKKLNQIAAKNDYPSIVAGDLNDIPGSTPINLMESVWGSSYEKGNPQPTFPSREPEVKIDYVMFYPKDRWKVIESEVICDAIASDHCAYLVVLELLPE